MKNVSKFWLSHNIGLWHWLDCMRILMSLEKLVMGWFVEACIRQWRVVYGHLSHGFWIIGKHIIKTFLGIWLKKQLIKENLTQLIQKLVTLKKVILTIYINKSCFRFQIHIKKNWEMIFITTLSINYIKLNRFQELWTCFWQQSFMPLIS